MTDGTTTEPSAGAISTATQILDGMKRAGAVQQHAPPHEDAESIRILAAFIDAETGLPELVAACKSAADALCNDDGIIARMARASCRTAIAKAEGAT